MCLCTWDLYHLKHVGCQGTDSILDRIVEGQPLKAFLAPLATVASFDVVRLISNCRGARCTACARYRLISYQALSHGPGYTSRCSCCRSKCCCQGMPPPLNLQARTVDIRQWPATCSGGKPTENGEGFQTGGPMKNKGVND